MSKRPSDPLGLAEKGDQPALSFGFPLPYASSPIEQDHSWDVTEPRSPFSPGFNSSNGGAPPLLEHPQENGSRRFSDGRVGEAGREMGAEAAFWSTYLDKAKEHDTNLISRWNGNMDILLIFTGLLSSILASFAIELYKSLQPDYQEYTALILLDISRSLHAIANGETPPERELPPESHPTNFRSSSMTQWMNLLCLGSLGLSLIVSIVVLLAKQWLHSYTEPEGLHGMRRSRKRATPRDQAQDRQMRYDGLLRWRVPQIINAQLTVLLMVLSSSAVWVILWLWPISSLISIAGTTLFGITFCFVVFTTFLPLFFPDCPYKTPTTDQIGALIRRIDTLRSRLFGFLRPLYPHSSLVGWLKIGTFSLQDPDQLEARSILWVLKDSREQPVVEKALQAMAGICTRSHFTATALLREEGVLEILCHQLLRCFHAINLDPSKPKLEKREEAGLYARAIVGLIRDVDTLPESQGLNLTDITPAHLQEISLDTNADVSASGLVLTADIERIQGGDPMASIQQLLSIFRQQPAISTMLRPFVAGAVRRCVTAVKVAPYYPLTGPQASLVMILAHDPKAQPEEFLQAAACVLEVIFLGRKQPSGENLHSRNDCIITILESLVVILTTPRYPLAQDKMEAAASALSQWTNTLPSTALPPSLNKKLLATFLLLVKPGSAHNMAPSRILESLAALPQILESAGNPEEIASALISVVRQWSHDKAALQATRLLRHLTKPDRASSIIEAEGIPALVGNLGSQNMELASASMEILCSLLLVSQSVGDVVFEKAVESGVLPQLVHLVGSGRLISTQSELWCDAIARTNKTPLREAILSSNVIPALIHGAESPRSSFPTPFMEQVGSDQEDLGASSERAKKLTAWMERPNINASP